MNSLSTKWVSDQEMEENSMIQEYDMNLIMGEINEAQYTLPHSFSTNTTTYILPKLPPPPFSSPPPPLPSSSNLPLHHHPSSRIFSLENFGPNGMDHEYSPTYLNSIFSPNGPSHEMMNDSITREINRKGTKRAQPLARIQYNAEDHIIAERKRREKFTERLVVLSSLVPGLKKMNKASVLEAATTRIKYLQERVKELEGEKKERRLEPSVFMMMSKLILDDNNQSSSPSSCEGSSSSLDLPEIEVRFLDKDVLIKILCEKQEGHISKIMAEIEKFRFSIINLCVLPFGSTLDITIIAQKESDFDMTLMDVVKSLRSGLSKFM